MNGKKLAMEEVTQVFSGTSGESVRAIENMNIAVKDREFLSIVGPSGCGKTTLLRILAGLLVPTQGRIIVDGEDVTGAPSKKRGVVFQQDAIFPWMTVEQNIAYGPKVNGVEPRKVKEITEKYIEMVKLRGFEKSLPKELSGGMKKRVDLARAYANSPEILLMDEPFGSLDSQTKSRMQTELLNIWSQEKKTVIFITHDLEEALYLSDRVIVLTPRPSKVLSELVVSLERTRDSSIKTDHRFVELRAQLEETLAEGIRRYSV